MDHAAPAAQFTTIEEFAALAAQRLRARFGAEREGERQVGSLADEAGEFFHAHRLWTLISYHREGLWEAVRDELADVVTAAHVTAQTLGVPLASGRAYQGTRTTDSYEQALRVFTAAGDFARTFYAHRNYLARAPRSPYGDALSRQIDQYVSEQLTDVLLAAYEFAAIVHIDIEAAWRDKAVKNLHKDWAHPQPEGTSQE